MFNIKVCLDSEQYSSRPKDIEVSKINKRIGSSTVSFASDKIREFAYAVANHGQTFCPATFIDGKRSSENFEQMELFALDFNSGAFYDTIKRRATHYDLPILFSYYTFGNCFSQERFRIVFLNDVPITDKRAAKIMLNMLMTIFPEAESTCNDATKMYFGGKGLIAFDPYVSTINIESVARNMSYYLKNEYGATHYKNKIVEFAKENQIALTKKNLLDIQLIESATEHSGTIDLSKYSPSTIIIYIANGDNLPTQFYLINLNCTSNSSVPKQNSITTKNHKPKRSYFLNDIYNSCRLFREYQEGTREYNHNELFGLATNLVQVESGPKQLLSILENYPGHDRWDYYLKYMKNYNSESCNLFCPYKNQCNHGKM